MNATVAESPNRLKFTVNDVTGNRSMPIEVPPAMPASQVAKAAASMMGLPQDVPWALRDDQSSVFVEDEAAIGEKVAPNANVTITPKTHLGGF